MSGRRVVLWRHGRTEWNATARFQGQIDVPLDEVGVLQADRAARDLATLNPNIIVSSDLDRARTTAQALAEKVNLTVTTDPALRETFAGEWQGLTRQEIIDRDGDDFYNWINGEDIKPGGGESRAEVAHRVADAVRRHLEQLPAEGTLVVATHGGAARAGIGELLGLPIEYWASLGGLVNCAWSVLEEQRDGRWRLVEHNARSLPEDVIGDET